VAAVQFDEPVCALLFFYRRSVDYYVTPRTVTASIGFHFLSSGRTASRGEKGGKTVGRVKISQGRHLSKHAAWAGAVPLKVYRFAKNPARAGCAGNVRLAAGPQSRCRIRAGAPERSVYTFRQSPQIRSCGQAKRIGTGRLPPQRAGLNPISYVVPSWRKALPVWESLESLWNSHS
jgi:hypothetical protein